MMLMMMMMMIIFVKICLAQIFFRQVKIQGKVQLSPLPRATTYTPLSGSYACARGDHDGPPGHLVKMPEYVTGTPGQRLTQDETQVSRVSMSERVEVNLSLSLP